jgi:hypothetical protein
MKHVVRMLCAVMLIFASSNAKAITCTRAQVSGVYCDTIINMNNSGQTSCIAENYNNPTKYVTFTTTPPSRTFTRPLTSYQFTIVQTWPDNTPHILCQMMNISDTRSRKHTRR